MKRFVYSLLFLSLLAVSCENVDKGTVWDNPNFMRLTAYTEKIAVSPEDSLSVSWVKGHSMNVFTGNSKKATLSTNSTTTNVFFTYDWYEDARPSYAVFPASDDVTCTADGVIALTVPSEQKVAGSGKVENFVAVGQIVGNRTSYQMNPIRNVTGHIAISLSYEVKSITIESVAGEPVAGRVSVNCGALLSDESDYLTVSQGQESVTLVSAEEDGVLTKGTHYVAVLPGVYEKGFKVTVSFDGVKSFEKEYLSDGVTVRRSALSSFGEEPADDNLPDEIRIDLDFSKEWPFVEEITSTDEQKTLNYAGKTYTYQYEYLVQGNDYQRDFSFFLKPNNSVYSYNDEALASGAKFFRITLPEISRRYIKAVKVDVLNDADHGKQIRLRKNGTEDDLVTKYMTSYNSPAVLSFPLADGTAPEISRAYILYLDTDNAFIRNISLIYARELPSAGEENPFGDTPSQTPALPDEFDVTLDFAAGWPFNGSAAPEDVQSNEGEPYTYTYNYELGGAPQTMELDFALWRGGLGTVKSYVYEDNSLIFKSDHKDNSTAMIKFPGIEGRYLKSVTVVHTGNGEPKPRFNINTGYIVTNLPNMTWPDRIEPNQEFTFTFPVKDKNGKVAVEPQEGQVYSLRTRDPNTKVTKVKLSYSKTKPE